MTDTPTIDLSKIKPGDELTLKPVKVTGAMSHGRVEVLVDGWRIPIPPSDIATHTPKPKPLEVGDRVDIKGSSYRDNPGRILAIDDDEAWVAWRRNGARTTVSLTRLERIP